MSSAFVTRLFSAIIMILGMIGLFYAGTFYLSLFCLGVMILMQFEISYLLFPQQSKKDLYYHLLVTTSATLLGAKFGFSLACALVLLGVVSLELFLLPRFFLKKVSTPEESLLILSKFMLLVIYGVFLPSFTYSLILFSDQGLFWFLFLLCTTLGSDTLAYFTGKRFGKTPLLPTISPNKTIEGSLGGALGAFLITFPFFIARPELPLGYLLLSALVSGFLGQVGDLFESLLKRVANKKDSGFLIPGHGGLLDRIDGIIFSSPWVYFVSLWLS
jgi:phosphatidate cytidylyltransferase